MNKTKSLTTTLFLSMFILLFVLVLIKSADSQSTTKNLKHNATGKLKITSPEEGAIFSPGDTVIMKVSYEGQPKSGIFFLTQDESIGADNLAPYEYQFQIKKEWLGPMFIMAWANENEGEHEEDGVEINVQTKDKPESISVSPMQYIYMKPDEEVMLYVKGTYSDGITRDITSHIVGTTYSSDNSSIATVSEDGVIKGVAVGETTIKVKNGVIFEIKVYVLRKKVRSEMPILRTPGR